MSLKQLVFALIVVFSTHTLSHAVDTLRYALIAAPQVKELPQLPSLIPPAIGKTIYTRIAAEPAMETAISSQEENLMNWTPMSIEALGYDIREVWREKVFTFWLGIGPR